MSHCYCLLVRLTSSFEVPNISVSIEKLSSEGWQIEPNGLNWTIELIEKAKAEQTGFANEHNSCSYFWLIGNLHTFLNWLENSNRSANFLIDNQSLVDWWCCDSKHIYDGSRLTWRLIAWFEENHASKNSLACLEWAFARILASLRLNVWPYLSWWIEIKESWSWRLVAKWCSWTLGASWRPVCPTYCLSQPLQSIR